MCWVLILLITALSNQWLVLSVLEFLLTTTDVSGVLEPCPNYMCIHLGFSQASTWTFGSPAQLALAPWSKHKVTWVFPIVSMWAWNILCIQHDRVSMLVRQLSIVVVHPPLISCSSQTLPPDQHLRCWLQPPHIFLSKGAQCLHKSLFHVSHFGIFCIIDLYTVCAPFALSSVHLHCNSMIFFKLWKSNVQNVECHILPKYYTLCLWDLYCPVSVPTLKRDFLNILCPCSIGPLECPSIHTPFPCQLTHKTLGP